MSSDSSLYARRKEERREVSFVAEISAGRQVLGCRLQNISVGGARIELDGQIEPGPAVFLSIEPFGKFPVEIAWNRGRTMGLKFKVDPGRMAEIVMAMAVY